MTAPTVELEKMELAQALLLLWRRRLWVALGLVVALGVGVISTRLLKQQVYSEASTQLIVESPRAPLGNAGAALTPFTSRASVFAELMATHPAVVEIAKAAGIPADQIVATGPASITGGAPVSSAAAPDGKQPDVPYKLILDQDPTLPTVDVYARAPTTPQAIDLANAAVKGFDNYLHTLEGQTPIASGQRVEIHQLGGSIGGVVDPGASKKIAAVLVLLVLIVWCALILLVERVRASTPPPSRAGGPDPVLGLGDDSLYDLHVGNGYSETAQPEDRDAALTELSDRIATLAERSPARDER